MIYIFFRLLSKKLKFFLGICGVHLNVKFSMPYVEFLPVTIPFIFQIEGEKVDLSLFVPEVCTSHDILKSLDMNAKIVNKDGIVLDKRACKYKLQFHGIFIYEIKLFHMG